MDYLRKIGIGLRLYIGVIIILMLFSALGYYTVSKINFMYSLTNALYDHPYTVTKTINNINANTIKVTLYLREMMSLKDQKVIEDHKKIVDEATNQILRDIDVLSRQFLGGNIGAIAPTPIITLKKQAVKWRDSHQEFFKLLREGNFDKAEKLLDSDVFIYRKNLSDSMQKISSIAEENAKGFLLKAEYTKRFILQLLYLLFFLSFVIIMTLAFFGIRSLTKPIRVLKNVTDEFSKGSLITDRNMGSNDEIGQISASIKNMTFKLHELSEELRLKNEITSNMAEGVYLVDASTHTIVYANPMFDNIFGYKSGEVLGQKLSILLSPDGKDSQEMVKEIVSALDISGVWKGEVENIRKDGTVFLSHKSISIFNHHEYGRVWLSCVRTLL
ncbi:MAG: PAS domain-containing protein [Nitrospirae bacterium]|nr:PAS domain-containing protein [Nitrospirota bacterium]